ncbi:DegT/DnrJ/EryC1/StrS family aminotransferase [Lysobacter sp. KIS68-7]|uniref:DegT/DnrJ/EryC1/StrS family aminotransferase n=1 Tax=Lysobacter sp. KIS68-7 TaxID=2904252 RepID=UPI001E62D024|nr:DegT/DnrJ/EryC1/StrS family aminotransferase [Lysobacter sp. KIS68-7]UHQ19920.1 DegT/DnrJ/EryC1/StrS family aminotransferase [Lysobacter sp. KIS68-7]
MSDEKIYVTRPFLPPLEELLPSLERIWATRDLTNGAAFHREFEQALARYLGVPFVSLFTNATIALVTALQCLRITGEVITTPYSFVATAHSLLWNGVEPVFVDIDPHTLTLDASRVEAAITPRTTAIMPVHVYGRPADVDGLQRIADTYGLKIIYDAAHAFGARFRGRSLADYGDLSVLSFHATKVFNTFEGGAIVSRDAQTKQRIDYLKNFGFADEVTVVAAGINGKMSEFQAALGMLQLDHIDASIRQRGMVAQRYDAAFADIAGIDVLGGLEQYVPNYSYYPIFVSRDFPVSRDDLYARLRDAGIHGRRYFYPLISDFPMYRGRPSAAKSGLPTAHRIADEVICLPIYPELGVSDQQRVIDCIRTAAT